jgi:hypothetical protein
MSPQDGLILQIGVGRRGLRRAGRFARRCADVARRVASRRFGRPRRGVAIAATASAARRLMTCVWPSFRTTRLRPALHQPWWPRGHGHLLAERRRVRPPRGDRSRRSVVTPGQVMRARLPSGCPVGVPRPVGSRVMVAITRWPSSGHGQEAGRVMATDRTPTDTDRMAGHQPAATHESGGAAIHPRGALLCRPNAIHDPCSGMTTSELVCAGVGVVVSD